jgi:hypothetical protein
MIGSFFTQHLPAVRNSYAGGTPAPPGPDGSVWPKPIDPSLLPIFNVVATPQITRYNGQSAAAVTLATISTTEASFSIVGDMPGGLAPSITAGAVVGGLNTFTVAWPASAPYVKPFGLYRSTLNYVRSTGDGGVFGSSLHEVLVLDPAILLTYSTRVDLVGRIAQPVSTTLAALTFAARADVTAAVAGVVPGLSFGLAWTPGATSSGSLSATGTPTVAGTYSVVATYSALGVVLGSSTHAVLIGAAAPPPAPTPAPVPAPAPLPPAPAPGAPAPGLPPASQGDALLASNSVRHHFHAAALVRATQADADTFHSFFATAGQSTFTLPVTLIGEDSVTLTGISGQGFLGEGSADYTGTVSGSTVTIAGAFRYEPVYCYYRVNRVNTTGWAGQVGGSFTGTGVRAEGSGAAGGAAYVYAGGALSASVSGCDGVGTGTVAELMALMSQATWDAHRAAAGGVNRYTPVLTLLTTAGALAWTFGFFSTSGTRYSAGDTRRVVMAAGFVGQTGGGGAFIAGPQFPDMPAGFIHLALGTKIAAGVASRVLWAGGTPGAVVTGAEGQIKAASPGRVQIAGSCPIPALSLYGGAGAALLKFAGAVDELRSTAAGSRYADYYAAAIPAASRQVPWPDY